MGRFIETNVLNMMLRTPRGMINSKIQYDDNLFTVFVFPACVLSDVDDIIDGIPGAPGIPISTFVGENFQPKGIAIVEGDQAVSEDLTCVRYYKNTIAECKFDPENCVSVSDVYKLSLSPGIHKCVDIYMNNDTNIVVYRDCCEVYEMEGRIHVTQDIGLTRIRFTLYINHIGRDLLDTMYCDILCMDHDIFVNESYIKTSTGRAVYRPFIDIQQFVEYVTGRSMKSIHYSEKLVFHGCPKSPATSTQIYKPTEV